MDLTIAQTVGVDISKDMLDVHPDNLTRRFTNNSKGFTALIDWLAQQGPPNALSSSQPAPITTPSNVALEPGLVPSRILKSTPLNVIPL